MVTKKGSVEFMPDEWKSQIAELARNACVMSEEDTARAIEILIDRCVTEAVISLMAELPDPVATMQDMVTRLEDAQINHKDGDPLNNSPENLEIVPRGWAHT